MLISEDFPQWHIRKSPTKPLFKQSPSNQHFHLFLHSCRTALDPFFHVSTLTFIFPPLQHRPSLNFAFFQQFSDSPRWSFLLHLLTSREENLQLGAFSMKTNIVDGAIDCLPSSWYNLNWFLCNFSRSRALFFYFSIPSRTNLINFQRACTWPWRWWWTWMPNLVP